MSKRSNDSVTDNENALKRKALEVTFAQIDKQFGNGAIMMLGQANQDKIKAISTGSLLIDHAIGVGGLPVGRVVEIFGQEATGKTTVALQAIAQSQANGGICAFIDAEHALDPTYAAKIGVNTDELIISQPDSGEQALDIAEMLVRSGAIDVLVVDSVAALVPRAELEGDMGDSHVGLQARLMSQALRKLTPVVHKSKTVFIFINQVRQTINAMAFAPKEVTSGGKALKFYASVRLDLRRIASLKKNDDHFGNRVRVKVVKNKVAPPFREAIVDVLFGKGISHYLETLDAAIMVGLIKQSGSWFSYDEKKLAQGRERVMELFEQDDQLFKEIRNKVVSILSSKHCNETIA